MFAGGIRNRVFGVATGYGLKSPWFETPVLVRDFLFSMSIQTSPGDDSASCTMGVEAPSRG
jgi:hypothetical protein